MVAFMVSHIMGLPVPWLAAGAALGLAAIGFADDRAGLAPVLRLAGQVGAGTVMGVAAGGGWLIPIGALVAPVIVNVVNFMDGINGITGFSMGVWGVTAWLAGVSANAPPVWVLGAAAAGAAFGFLPWNAPTARLFLGDVGSYLFGGLIAAAVVVGLATKASPVVLIAPLVLYLADTGTVVLSRAARGVSLMEAHREHAYQRLTGDVGVSHVAVALSIALVAAASAAMWALTPRALATLFTICAVALYLMLPNLLTAKRSQ
ncbi:hypothetical protein ASG70_06430 [Phycicoccus sp. Soil748]|nr:hypothetical protein ASG70_06430 [Phycicoccus sp. Soil748]